VLISNIPDIRDVNKLIELLQKMGVDVAQKGKGEFEFQARNVNFDYLNTEDFKKQASGLRGSIMIVGPLLARFGRARIPMPGGDKIGRRRLDTHFIGFQSLGAQFDFDTHANFYEVAVPAKSSLKGT